MANSRLEKIGTIYTRTRGLIQSAALNYNDRPIWFDVYEAFPPKEDPRFDRPIPNMKIKEIFYEEDKVRAQLHKNLGRVGTVNLLNHKTPSFTQKFLNTYKKLEGQYGVGQCQPDQLYNEALDMLKREREAQLQAESTYENVEGSLTKAFKNATLQQKRMDNANNVTAPINVKDLFKE